MVCGLVVNQRNKGEECFFMDLGATNVNEASIGGNERSKYGDFSWAELWQSGVPLAEL